LNYFEVHAWILEPHAPQNTKMTLNKEKK